MTKAPKRHAELANRAKMVEPLADKMTEGMIWVLSAPVQLHVPIVTLSLFHNLFPFTVLFCTNNHFIFLLTNLTSFLTNTHLTCKKQIEILTNCFYLNFRNVFYQTEIYNSVKNIGDSMNTKV